MFYVACKLAGIIFGVLFPAYSSYKAIRVNDAQAIETWLMYWVVMSAVHAVETTAEWTVNWLPFYYEMKAMLVIWLTLPQIQGSTFVYVSYIHPFLLKHEQEIDDTLAQAKTKARAAGLDYAKRAWLAIRDTVIGAVAANGGDAQAAAALTGGSAPPAPSQQPNTDHSTPQKSSRPSKPASAFDPLASPALGAWNLANTALKTYGPAAIAAGHALFRPVQASGASPEAMRKKNDDYAALGRGSAPRRPTPHSEEDDRVEPLQARSTGHSRSASRQAEDNRLYQQEVGRQTAPSRRTASASAVMGATTAYATYSRDQLRQRRLQLEAELAALESPNTLLSPGDKPSRTPSPGSDPPVEPSYRLPSSTSMPLQPLRTRERHVSGPASAGVRGGRISPMTASYASPLEGSVFENIAREDADDTLLPPDWGRRADRSGWKGAPPSAQQQQQRQRTASQSALATSMGPSTSTPQARQNWFWSSTSAAPLSDDSRLRKET